MSRVMKKCVKMSYFLLIHALPHIYMIDMTWYSVTGCIHLIILI